MPLEEIRELVSALWPTLVPVLISILALSLTIWQGWMTRKHNRLSTKPFLDFSWQLNSEFQLSCELKNLGLGPALIQKVRYFIEGEEIVIEGRHSYQLLFAKLDLDTLIKKIPVTHIHPGTAFSIGHSECIFDLSSSSLLEGENKLISEKFKALSLQVEYESIYGIKYKSLISRLLN